MILLRFTLLLHLGSEAAAADMPERKLKANFDFHPEDHWENIPPLGVTMQELQQTVRLLNLATLRPDTCKPFDKVSVHCAYVRVFVCLCVPGDT